MKYIEDFAKLNFRIECIKIILTQCKNNPLVFCGPGEIWQDKEGCINFKFFIDDINYINFKKFNQIPYTHGQIISDEEYFKLEALDISNNLFHSEKILPNVRGGIESGLIFGNIYELYQEFNVNNNSNNYTKLRLQGKLKFPCNNTTETVTHRGNIKYSGSWSRDVAIFEFDGNKLTLYHVEDHTVVEFKTSISSSNVSISDCIIKSLQFVLAQKIQLLVIEEFSSKVHTTSLLSLTGKNGSMLPPLTFEKLDGDKFEFFEKLFIKYFQFINAEKPKKNTISIHLGKVLESMTGSLETKLLTLSVAIEGLAKDYFDNISPIEPDFCAELDAILKKLPEIEFTRPSDNKIDKLSKKTIIRLKGSLGSMKKPRGSDIIQSYIRNNNLSQDLYDAWKITRNISAHGGSTIKDNLGEAVRRKDKLTTLFYSLVLSIIQYTGNRTDYSKKGWPIVNWPPVK